MDNETATRGSLTRLVALGNEITILLRDLASEIAQPEKGIAAVESLQRELLKAIERKESAEAKRHKELEKLLERLAEIETMMPGHKQVEGIGMMSGFGLVLLSAIALLLGLILWRLW